MLHRDAGYAVDGSVDRGDGIGIVVSSTTATDPSPVIGAVHEYVEPKPTFLPALEPLRGLAALTVAVMHAFYVLDSPANYYLSTFINGHAAVTLFFVLSGVVLGLALDRYPGNLWQRWRQFMILRCFRIYPMVIVVTAVIAAYLLLRSPGEYPGASDWFGKFYQDPITPWLVVKNMALANAAINPIAWTLMVEIAVALIFPVMHVVSRRIGTWNIAVLLALFALVFLPDSHPNSIVNAFTSLVFPHAYKFYLGLMLTQLRPRKFHWSYFLPLLVILASTRYVGESEWIIGIETIAAGAVLYPLLSQSYALLNLKPVQWLGRISYSFYLWHFIVLYAFTTVLLPLPVNATLVSSMIALYVVLITAALSHVTYTGVERPFMRMGRRLIAPPPLPAQSTHRDALPTDRRPPPIG